MQPKAIACVHLQPAPRHDGVSRGVGRVSPAANCAAVTGEGNQLNPRAGGQTTRQARQTRLNEWETINNFGEEATVNKMMAPKVKVLPAVGKGERGKGREPEKRNRQEWGPPAWRQAPSTRPPSAVRAAYGYGSCSPSSQHRRSLSTGAVTTRFLPPC